MLKILQKKRRQTILADQGKKELTKEEKANKVADGLAALAEGMGGAGMSGTMSRGFVGQLLELVKFKSWYG